MRHAEASDGARLAADVTALRAAIAHAPSADVTELAGVAAMHEIPWVRLAVLQALVARAPQHVEVREVAAWLTHDYEDFVAFEAIDLAGRLGLREVLADLFVIVGRASERMHGVAGKPVGIGHAVVLRAIAALVGSHDAEEIARVEQELFSGGLDEETYPVQPPRDAARAGVHSHRGMVPVAGGRVRGGPPPAFDPHTLMFDWNDPEITGSCEDFWIDVVPVSNVEYDAFARSAAARHHVFCHPAEPKVKLHLRNTLLDSRSEPDHPVTGVDWFDAYAYARAQGKRLPTETEWQRSGEGEDRRAYPWGDVFDPSRTHCRPVPETAGWEGLLAWRADLLRLADGPPATTTRARQIAGSASPWGALDLSGNVWEWTASSFDGPPFSPVGTERDAIDVIYDRCSYAVIKGGTFTSLPEQVSVAFRGRDLALDRHFEIGFRCACSGTH
jgi:formylglycine-generating enzyme required for sulfatase activity